MQITPTTHVPTPVGAIPDPTAADTLFPKPPGNAHSCYLPPTAEKTAARIAAGELMDHAKTCPAVPPLLGHDGEHVPSWPPSRL